MKKKWYLRFISIIAIVLVALFTHESIVASNTDNNCDSYMKVIQYLVYPDVRSAIKERYDDYTKVNSYDINIVSIAPNESGNLNLVVQFYPFKGAHVSLSKDEITFLVTNRELMIQEYRHLQKKSDPWLYEGKR